MSHIPDKTLILKETLLDRITYTLKQRDRVEEGDFSQSSAHGVEYYNKELELLAKLLRAVNGTQPL